MVTELYIEGYQVDLLGDISIPTTYAIADIKEPQKRQSSFSKTVSIPSTAANDKIFGHIWDIRVAILSSGTTNFSPNFNPAKRAKVQVMYDGATTFSGIIQLNSITIQDGYTATYECTMFSSLTSLFSQIGEAKLNEIDLSEYNHTYNRTNQVNSWNTSIIKNGGTYVNFSGGLPTGEGYTYPMIDYGRTNGNTFDVTDNFPAVYLKTLTDKIIGDAGFQYQSSFFTSAFYKKLVVPFNSGTLKLTDTTVANRTFWAGLQTIKTTQFPQGAGSTSWFNFTDEVTAPYNDAGAIHTTSGSLGGNTVSYLTVPFAGTYLLEMRVDLTVTHYPSGGSGGISSQKTLGYVILKRWNNGNPVNMNAVPVIYSHNNSIVSNSSAIVINNTTVGVNKTTGQQESSNGYIVATQFNAAQNDIYFYQFVQNPNSTDLYGGTTGYTQIDFNPSCYFKASLANTNVSAGDTVELSSILPNNIKQADLLSSVFKAFNLFAMPDKDIPNKLIIEPRDDFYSSGTTRDWTYKLDYLKDWEVKPMGELDAKRYLFTYKEDGDYYNDFYKNRWGEVYGQRRYEIDNDFLKEEIKTELIFSPTPLADYVGIDRIIPKIFGVTSQNTPEPKTSNVRLLMWGGVKTTGQAYAYTENGSSTNYTTYLYCGHLDDTTFPTIDLNFGIPQEVYYTATAYTNGNLFNRYHKRYIQEISDKDSKIFTGYFNLKPVDIANIDFRDQYYFEDTYWRLNKIYDFNPTQAELTKCEFVRLKEYVTPTISSGTIRGGSTQINGEFAPTAGSAASELAGGRLAFNVGTNNAIPIGTIGFISGRGNTIRGQQVSVLNSSGVTAVGERITAIQSSGTNILSNDVIAINCGPINISSGGIWINDKVAPDFAETLKLRLVTTTYTINPATDNVIYGNDAGGNFTITLPRTSDVYTLNGSTRGFTIIKINSSANRITVAAAGGESIIGSATYTITSQYTAINIVAGDGIWYLK